MPRKNNNVVVNLRAKHHVIIRRGVGYASTDQGGGSGRLGTRSNGSRGKARYASLQPEAGSNLARAWS